MIEYNFNFISSTVFTTIAIIGNSLVLIILTSRIFRKNSFFRFMIVATVFDTLHVLAMWPSNFPDFFKINQLSISCKLFAYLSIVFGLGSPWMNLLSSIDSYLSIKFPTKDKFRNQVKYQVLAMITVGFTILIINVPFILYVDAKTNSTDGSGCMAMSFTAGIYMNGLNLLMSTIIPFFFILVSTSLIAYELIVLKKKRFQKRKFQKEKRLVKTLFILNFFYLLTNLPFSILVWVYGSLKINFFGTLGYFIVLCVGMSYSSLPFFIFLMFNNLFRKSIVSLFIKKKTNVSLSLT